MSRQLPWAGKEEPTLLPNGTRGKVALLQVQLAFAERLEPPGQTGSLFPDEVR